MMAEQLELRIDGGRLWHRLEALGEIGAVHGPNGERGCARLALTDGDRDGRDLVVSWMVDLGMHVSIDAIGNVVATRAGSDPTAAAVMVGSHIDTVRTGGRFDGNLGVLAGLEIVETLAQNGITTLRPIQVAFFTDEEGARFAPDMLGSLVYVGGIAVEEALDVTAADDGARLGDELTRIGYAGPTPVPAAGFPHCYTELHIEQGPVLADEDVTIGVVTGVQGISWTEVTITGQSAHAGTTPMQLRRDPLAVAARAIHEIRLIAGYLGASQVATVGMLDVLPNLVNVIPSAVTFTVDLRNIDEARLKEAEAEVFGKLRDTGDLNAGFGLKFKGRDDGAGVDLDHRSGDVELFELHLDSGGGFVEFLFVVLGAGGRFAEQRGWRQLEEGIGLAILAARHFPGRGG